MAYLIKYAFVVKFLWCTNVAKPTIHGSYGFVDVCNLRPCFLKKSQLAAEYIRVQKLSESGRTNLKIPQGKPAGRYHFEFRDLTQNEKNTYKVGP